MALFQVAVISKYLNTQSKDTLSEKWNVYRQHFLNPSVQENIRNSKEEQYQGEFLIDLFVKVLGYTKKPTPNFNLTTELKNVKDSKKADGGIIMQGKVIGVIELKGTKTTDLNKIETQAFGYKNNQTDCVYVITSNFEKLRFYIENAIEHLEFNLFTLTEREFSLLYLCLGYENIAQHIPKKIKEESLNQEDAITKKLYKDYTLFKGELYQNLLSLNPQIEPLLLFQKTQKLLDRFLFLFFAEDRQLLPPNSIRQIFAQWTALKKWKKYEPLYELYKNYFSFLNTGNKDLEVFAYNGGLFASDEILDSLKIDDTILHQHTQKMSNYDFASEVDVNILGHIFENSLNELDEIKAQLAGETIEKAQTKRKKDGVFYTPRYITKYIVENTVGKLCEAQKKALHISEEEYFADKKRSKDQKKRLLAPLESYRNWLLQLTILDPACGSGAFLNEALNFLIAEHAYIDELQAKLFGDSLILSDVENTILENNLFGVDLNEESIEIAKLSLWLRTARPGRKLNHLNNNLKCGNSLIDSPLVAGNKAFDWKKEFPHIFENGGFDVVIGNPPYGVHFTETEKRHLVNFDSLVPDYEAYIYFISLHKKILKHNGLLSYIFPNTFLSTLFGKKYRESLFNHTAVYQIVDLSNDITFTDAAVRTCIFSFARNEDDYECTLLKVENKEFLPINTYLKHDILSEIENVASLFSQNNAEKAIIQKLQKNEKLETYFEVSQGLIPYDKYRGHDEQTIKNRIWHSDYKKDETYKKELKGGDVNRYNINWNGNLWISYGEWLAAPRNKKYFVSKRILVREITADKLFCAYTEEEFYNTPSCINLINEKNILALKYALTLLNSQLIAWLHNKVSPKANKGLFPKILINDIRNIPLVAISAEKQQPFIEQADKMLSLNKTLQELSQKVQRNISREFSINDLSKKLENWYSLTYKEFLEELEKKKVKLSLAKKAEWEEYFLQESEKAKTIAQEIAATDKTIDKMVYALYELTEEEIAIVEKG